MDGLDFERFVADRMKEFGWNCTYTPLSGDFGADIICTLGSKKLIIQCKCYADNNSVGSDAVSQALSAVAHYAADHGIVVYRGRPTRNARRLGETTGISLFHIEDLKPGWRFDKTADGERIRRLEAQQKAQEEALRREREASEYQAALADFEESDRQWRLKSKSHEEWQGIGAFLLIVAFLTLIGGELTWAAILGIGGAYAYYWKSPGDRPPRPIVPEHLRQVSPSVGLRSSSPEQSKRVVGSNHGAVSAVQSASFTITRTSMHSCEHCGTDFSVTLHRHEVQTRCPNCLGLIEAPRPQ